MDDILGMLDPGGKELKECAEGGADEGNCDPPNLMVLEVFVAGMFGRERVDVEESWSFIPEDIPDRKESPIETVAGNEGTASFQAKPALEMGCDGTSCGFICE